MSRQLFRSTTLVSGNTLISRVFGFIRDIVFAHYFGATAGADAFFVAFRIPNFMRALFAEGAFSQAFVPVLSRHREAYSPEKTRQFIDHITGILTFFLILVVVPGVILAPTVIKIFATGFIHDPTRFMLASHILRIIFPYILLISLTALFGAILNTYDSFGVPSFTPVILNIVIIVTAIFIAPHFAVPIYVIAWGVLVAGMLQVIFQLPFLYAKKLMPRPRLSFRDAGVKQVLKLMVPALIGVSIVQISLILDNIFASFLKVGSVSWLYYSSRLMNFPLGVFGVAIATVILPKLSRQHISKDASSYSKTLDWALRIMLLIGLPSTIGLLMLAGPLLSTLFQTGHFTQYDVEMSRLSLMAFSIGIVAFMLVKILASAFYAKRDIATPVKIAAGAVIVKIILNIILIVPLKHAGLALSTSLAAFTNVFILAFLLFRRRLYMPQSGWLIYFIRLAFANIILIIVLYLMMGHLVQWFDHGRLWRVLHLSELVVVAIVSYFLALIISGLRLKHFHVT